MDGVVEIITGRERRWRWSLQDKVRVVAETNEPGSMIRAVTARHGICESLLFTWRRQAREGLMGPPGWTPSLPPCRIVSMRSRRPCWPPAPKPLSPWRSSPAIGR